MTFYKVQGETDTGIYFIAEIEADSAYKAENIFNYNFPGCTFYDATEIDARLEAFTASTFEDDGHRLSFMIGSPSDFQVFVRRIHEYGEEDLAADIVEIQFNVSCRE